MPYTLGYWKIRGLRTPITYCLEFASAEYTEEFFEIVPDKDGNLQDRSQWYDVKESKPLDFPNLPYFYDGELKITQMAAIMKYICRKHNVLLPENNTEWTLAEMMMGVTGDFRSGFTTMCYRTGDKDGYEKDLPTWLGKFEKYFADKTYCAGSRITFADMNLYDILDHHVTLFPECFKNFSNVEAFHARIKNEGKIKAYLESDRFFARPLNNLSAHFK